MVLCTIFVYNLSIISSNIFYQNYPTLFICLCPGLRPPQFLLPWHNLELPSSWHALRCFEMFLSIFLIYKQKRRSILPELQGFPFWQTWSCKCFSTQSLINGQIASHVGGQLGNFTTFGAVPGKGISEPRFRDS